MALRMVGPVTRVLRAAFAASCRVRSIALLSTLLGVLMAGQAVAQSLVGAWVIADTTAEGASVVVFLGNGAYAQIQNAKASEAPHGFDGYELGTYTWDATTGAFTVTTVQDRNGDTGLSNISSLPGLTVVVSGNVATITIPGNAPVAATRVTGTSPIVGAWGMVNPAVLDSSLVAVFLPNGIYFLLEDGDSTPGTGDPTGHDGIEHGTYSWDRATGTLTTRRSPAPFVDTNGEWGLSNTKAGTTFTVSADGLTFTVQEGTDIFQIPRIGGVSTSGSGAVVEYYHAAFDHYFITAATAEIAALDAGVFVGWTRTGRSFGNYPLNTAGTANVCRFFSTNFAPKSSHFYTPSAQECEHVKSSPDWVYEDVVFAVVLSDAATGACPAGTWPLYRMYNNGQGGAPNHRYSNNVVVRAAMLTAGWVPEGYGAAGVIGCVPTAAVN